MPVAHAGGAAKAGAKPLAGLGVADIARDVVSAVASFAALGALWDFNPDVGAFKGGDHWWVVIAVLLSVGSLTLPYLHRMKMLGSLGLHEVRLIKLAAIVPTVVSILVVLIQQLVHIDESDGAFIGSGVVMLAAGAVLALQPRASEGVPGHVAGLWKRAALIAGAVAVVLAVVTTVGYLAFEDYIWDDVLNTIAYAARTLGGFAIVFAIPFVRAIGRNFAATAVTITVGASIIASQLLSGMGDNSIFDAPHGSLRSPVFAATFLVVIAVAIFASRPLLASVQRQDVVEDWVSTARLALGLTATYSALFVASSMLVTAEWGGKMITALVLMAVVGGVALAASRMLTADASANRNVVAILLAVGVVVGIVAISLRNSSGGGADWLDTAAVLGLPLLALGALTIPKTVRQKFGPLYTPPVETENPTGN